MIFCKKYNTIFRCLKTLKEITLQLSFPNEKNVLFSAVLNVIMHFCVLLQPHVRVWNSVSLHTLAVIGIGEFERSICCLSFSKAVSTLILDLCTDQLSSYSVMQYVNSNSILYIKLLA
jgi:hypothetical protein